MLNSILNYFKETQNKFTQSTTNSVKISFTCNICGSYNFRVPKKYFVREDRSCKTCGSSVRTRSLIYALSIGLFKKPLTIDNFPIRKDIVGVGMSDWLEYAQRLEKKLSYTNTFYHQEPMLDIVNPREKYFQACDFVITSDVFEHITPPVTKAFESLRKIVKPGGVVVFSVPYSVGNEKTIEHFPTLNDWKMLQDTSGDYYIENTTSDGKTEIFKDLIFHGGPGQTVEMRLFCLNDLIRLFKEAGFKDVQIINQDYNSHGIMIEHPWSLVMLVHG